MTDAPRNPNSPSNLARPARSASPAAPDLLAEDFPGPPPRFLRERGRRDARQAAVRRDFPLLRPLLIKLRAFIRIWH